MKRSRKQTIADSESDTEPEHESDSTSEEEDVEEEEATPPRRRRRAAAKKQRTAAGTSSAAPKRATAAVPARLQPQGAKKRAQGQHAGRRGAAKQLPAYGEAR